MTHLTKSGIQWKNTSTDFFQPACSMIRKISSCYSVSQYRHNLFYSRLSVPLNHLPKEVCKKETTRYARSFDAQFPYMVIVKSVYFVLDSSVGGRHFINPARFQAVHSIYYRILNCTVVRQINNLRKKQPRDF